MKKKREWTRRVSLVAFFIYLAVLAYFCFFSEGLNRGGADSYRYNLTVFREIQRAWYCFRQGDLGYFFLNVVLNIAAFVPFGFFLPIIRPKNKKLFHIFILSLELSLAIEILQLLFRVGIFDVDDLIMNTLGGVLGYGIYHILDKKLGRKKSYGRQ